MRPERERGLAARLATGDRAPDAGPARFDARTGAVLVGARDVLVAFNVWLSTGDVSIAREIARTVRESSGGLPAVQAMGLPGFTPDLYLDSNLDPEVSGPA